MSQPESDLQQSEHDLRSFIDRYQSTSGRDFFVVDKKVSGHWETAAITTSLAKKMRMPIVEYRNLKDSDFSLVHNVCTSLNRIAKYHGWSLVELSEKLDSAYNNPIPPTIAEQTPVRERLYKDHDVDLGILPGVRYTETETHPYVSAAHIVVQDPVSCRLNVSFHRLMVLGENTVTIFITQGSHLDQVFKHNAEKGADTAVAGFIGAHPSWSLGALSSGSLSMEEYAIMGGIIGQPIPVAQGIKYPELVIPARAEFAFEGCISCQRTANEGPYGEAFGFVSSIKERPLVTIECLSHRENALFQDIIPGELEHLTMTGIAIQVHLNRSLKTKYQFVKDVFFPSPMMVYVSVTDSINKEYAHQLITDVLRSQRFVKQLVLLDDSVDSHNAKQVAMAFSFNVQAERDVLVFPGNKGNELDPSELNGQTTKWGIDATSYTKPHHEALRNKIPDSVVQLVDIDDLLQQFKQCA